MSDYITSDRQLEKEAESIAQSVFDDFKERHGDHWKFPEGYESDMLERIWEEVDSSQYVIYTYRAKLIVGNCNCDLGESWLEDCSSNGNPFSDCESFGEVCTKLAFAELLCRSENALRELIPNWKPVEQEESE